MEQKPKGTRDILPKDSFKWQFMEEEARKIAKLYNVSEIRTPTFESESLFNRSVGETSDIVTKEMYTFKDKGGRDMALRPEGTAGVVRAFIENGMFNDAQPTKVCYFANMFRYENVQKGRFREFTQFGVECFGSKEPTVDAELIVFANDYLKQLGVNDYIFHINNIGCSSCRPKYNEALKEFAHKHQDKLCEDCKKRMATNPLRMLDCKNEACQKVFADAPQMSEFLCDECKEHFSAVLKLLDEQKVKYVLDAKLVRGLDYYTKTVFEIVSLVEGKELSIGGGGRYDTLLKQIGNVDMPAAGFGFGLDRVVLLLDESKIQPKDLIYVANAPDVSFSEVLSVAQILRSAGLQVETNLSNRSFKAQMKYADKLGATKVVILGKKEIETGQFVVKNLLLGSECAMDAKNLINYLKLNVSDIKKITKTYRD